jgi:uncharacterized membrane protein YfcA
VGVLEGVKNMAKIVDWLDGKKTFIGAAIIFIAGGLRALQKIDEETFNWIVAIGGSISVYGLRMALRKRK